MDEKRRQGRERIELSDRLIRTQKGNVFFALFGAVAVVGVLGAAIMATMRGPLSTMVEVKNRTQAETEMSIAAKLALLEATQDPFDGDCDGDGFIEPLPYNDTAPQPTGGGQIPAQIGSNKEDPWGTPYGYCVWDAGTVTVSDNIADCGGNTAKRLAGESDGSSNYTVIAIVSAGPDKIFQTTCSTGAGASTAEVTKAAGSDDLINSFDYGEATAASGGLWTLKTGDPTVAEIGKDLEVAGGAKFTDALDLTTSATAQLKLGAASMLLPDQTVLNDASCGPANNLLLRINTSGASPALEVCNGDGVTDTWISVAGASGPWVVDAADQIHYGTTLDAYQVGINNENPDDALDVTGNIGLTGDIEISDTKGLAWGAAYVRADGNGITLNSTAGSDELTINKFGALINGRLDVEGRTSDNTNYALNVKNSSAQSIIYARNDKQVGINNAAPNDEMDVTGTIDSSGGYKIDDNLVFNIPDGIESSLLIGKGAGLNVAAADNIIIGTDVGGAITTGAGNIMIGSKADTPDPTLDGYLSIGNIIHGTMTPTKRIGIGFADNYDATGFNDTLEVNGSIDAVTTIHATTNMTAGGNITATGDVSGDAVNASSAVNVDGDRLGPPAQCTNSEKLKWVNTAGWSCITDLQGGGGGGAPDLADVLGQDNDAGGLDADNFDQIGANQFCNATLTSCFDPSAASNYNAGMFEKNGTVVRSNSSAVDYTTYDFVFGSTQLADTGNAAHDSRFWFDKSKGAFRAGSVLGTEWNDANVGNFSVAFGTANKSSGATSMSWGSANFATGQSSTAWGEGTYAINQASTAFGINVAANGLASVAVGLYDVIVNTPQVSGDYSFGIFMGSQDSADLQATRTLGLYGGKMLIDPADDSAIVGTSVGGDQDLALDVEGPIGATAYCDNDGNNCFVSTDVTGGGGGGGSLPSLFEKNGTVVRSNSAQVNYTTDDFVFGSTQLADTGTAGHDSRFWFDKSKGAFRAGEVNGTEWDDANVGNYSAAFGFLTKASGQYGFATGFASTASGVSTSVIGSASTASGANSGAFGNNLTASGANSFALGYSAVAGNGTAASGFGNYSFAFGLGLPSGTYPRVTGTSSYGIFLGDQKNADLSSSNVLGLLGGRMVIDPTVPSTTTGVSTGSQQLELDVEGDIGGVNYCDNSGNNCFTPGMIASKSAGMFERFGTLVRPNSTVVVSTTDDFVFGSTQLADTGNANDDSRMYFDKSKGAFRAGTVASSQWNDTTANVGTSSAAFGNDTTASGGYSAAFGNGSTASGPSSVAFGNANTASGWYSVASGSGSTASGTLSVALGNTNVASGANSIALNSNTQASGASASTFGTYTQAAGPNATAFGYATYASGDYSIAAGRYVLAGNGTGGSGFGNFSVAFGLGQSAGTIASYPRVTGTSSFGVFMGNQQNVNLSGSNIFAIYGGKMLIDPSTGSAVTTARASLDLGYATDALIVPNGTSGQIPAGIDGMIRFNTSNGSFEVYEGAWIDMAAAVSDRRLKRDIHELNGDDILSRLDKVKTYSFVMKSDQSARKQYGVIAQQLEEIFPEMVGTSPGSDQIKSVHYMDMIGPLIEAAKALKAQNESLKSEIADMRKDQAGLQNAVADLQDQVDLLSRAAGDKAGRASSETWLLPGMLVLLLLSGAGFAAAGRRRKS